MFFNLINLILIHKKEFRDFIMCFIFRILEDNYLNKVDLQL